VIQAASGGGMATEPTMMSQLEAVPDCRVVKLVYPQHERRTLTEFMREFEGCDRRIWIHRDPRDQLVSVFLYTWFRGHRMPEDRFRTALSLVQARERGDRIPFSDLLKQTFGPRTFYHDPAYHLDRVLPYFHSDVSSRLFRFAYENLIAGRFDDLSAYLGMPLAGAEVGPAHARVVRSRGSGEWRRWFEPVDADRLRPMLGPYMELMGYENDWEPSDEAPDPVTGSCYMTWLWAGGTGERPRTVDEAEELLAASMTAEEPSGVSDPRTDGESPGNGSSTGASSGPPEPADSAPGSPSTDG
jgi:hypothetical protein